ncbi:hypothetical protein [Dyadobacter pollutisoli]|uniref:Uncharacterized protein n=1 Tax=Dyadobacter pollutisoli TaxID=2910158 RepID=A0A9E8N5M2_9BACT|nr:hypothetical protein [Dyadobacter pollutisoli]WAC10220.1 hypothetical protein ON006_20960 [Dyadobacter pollutisoli]
MNSCQSQDAVKEKSEEIFRTLKNNEARILVRIGDKEFYSPESVFTGQILMSDNMMSMTLTDQFEGKTIINLGSKKWFSKKPVHELINAENQVSTNVKMGKIVDREKMIGEGYMMAYGEITAVEFLKDKMVFKIMGKVGKYSDFQQPDKYLPAEGIIVYKKPAVSFGNVTENEVFSSTTSN